MDAADNTLYNKEEIVLFPFMPVISMI